MLNDPEIMREYHVTFYAGYREWLGMATVVARVYTIHAILVQMALRLLPSDVEREYNRYSVMQGAFVEGNKNA